MPTHPRRWYGIQAFTLCLLLLVASAHARAQSSDPTASTSSAAEMSDEARAYLTVALDSLQATSIRRATTDWRAVRDSAFVLAAGARRLDQTYGAINWALRRVDRHSFLQAPFPWVNADLLESRVGYVRVPAHPAGSQAALADTLQQVLRLFDEGGACAWIVDLRMNGGGNVWPMYAGIGPLLADSVIAVTLVDGHPLPTTLYAGGEAIGVMPDGERITVARAEHPHRMHRPDAPVAVLIDAGTGSSGEAVAIAFRTRTNTRFFGQPTAGYTTSNRGVLLSDGANLVVTTEPMTDRNGREYADPVAPDEVVEMPHGWWPSSRDAVARRAEGWLRQQPGCSGG